MIGSPKPGTANSRSGPASVDTAPTAQRQATPRTDDKVAPSPYRAPLPKQCDNVASLQFVVVRLDSKATPDDVRGFLADERFRLLRCEFTRFTAEERRDRENAMREIEAADAARRHAAMARVEALYDRYLTADERAARARGRQR